MDLYGNGVTMVPNVQAVMAWAVSRTDRQRGISMRGATKLSRSGGRVAALLPENTIQGITNVISTYP